MNRRLEMELNSDEVVPDSRSPTSNVVANFMRRNANGKESITATLYTGSRGVTKPAPISTVLIVRDPDVARSIMEDARKGSYGEDVYMRLFMPNGKTVITNLNPGTAENDY